MAGEEVGGCDEIPPPAPPDPEWTGVLEYARGRGVELMATNDGEGMAELLTAYLKLEEIKDTLDKRLAEGGFLVPRNRVRRQANGG